MHNTSNNPLTQYRSLIKWGLLAISALLLVIGFFGTMERNDDANWQVVQYPWGTVEVVDKAGYYPKWFGSVWTYPRNAQFEFTKEKTKNSPTDESTRVTFNDGGTSDMNVMARIAMPASPEAKRAFHRLFGGNLENVKDAVWGHISNVLKATGPLMSASEHQSSRKGEFTQIATEQLNKGLFDMRRIEKTLKDQNDEKGNPITVYATEVVLDSATGQPRIAQVSPYVNFGITVQQFSITETDYDEQTRKQFAQKKDSFLKAESAKAQREQEVQQRLMIVEQGMREKSEYEAKANKEKAAAVIEGQKQKEVAELAAQQAKSVAETKAAQEVAVATLEKQRAETDAAKVKAVAEMKAAQELAVATLARQTADQDKAAQIARAEGQQEALKIAGAISERDRVLAEIAKDQAIGVAKELSQIRVPSVMVQGGGAGAASNVTGDLINLALMERLGVINPAPERPRLVQTAAAATRE
jgi:regulator of protease activity HflC (stomatin/prohibitin superfamily)